MKLYFKKNKNYLNNRGYAILFTVILISIISAISIGLSNTNFKQLTLSSGFRDSQTAFYESDMATECGLYADTQKKTELDNGTPINCGVDKNGNSFTLNVNKTNISGGVKYTLTPNGMSNSNDPCFRIVINKYTSTTPVKTTTQASGYNICDLSAKRTVERTIEVNY